MVKRNDKETIFGELPFYKGNNKRASSGQENVAA